MSRALQISRLRGPMQSSRSFKPYSALGHQRQIHVKTPYRSAHLLSARWRELNLRFAIAENNNTLLSPEQRRVDTTRVELGERLRVDIKNAGLKLNQVARALNMKPSALRQILKGIRSFSKKVLVVIAGLTSNPAQEYLDLKRKIPTSSDVTHVGFYYETFGKHVWSSRMQLGLSGKEVARELCISGKKFNLIERGINLISPDVCEKLDNALSWPSGRALELRQKTVAELGISEVDERRIDTTRAEFGERIRVDIKNAGLNFNQVARAVNINPSMLFQGFLGLCFISDNALEIISRLTRTPLNDYLELKRKIPTTSNVIHVGFYYEAFGRHVSLARKELGITQEIIARQMGLKHESFGRIERGFYLPKPDRCEQLDILLQWPPGKALELRKQALEERGIARTDERQSTKSGPSRERG